MNPFAFLFYFFISNQIKFILEHEDPFKKKKLELQTREKY